ncbi:MAG: ABC transporter permease [Candidatus Aenigmatarchaeota archaeon]
MKLTDIIKLSISNLSQRGLRSWLTVLGIVIGVAAVIAILSIGAGMQQTISFQLSGLGADIITISPGFARAFTVAFQRVGQQPIIERAQVSTYFTEKDVQAIKSVEGIVAVNKVIYGRANVTYLAQSASISVYGVEPLAWKEILPVEIEEGRYLMPGDSDAIVVGNRVANQMFKKPLGINTQLTINGKPFKIVGILKESGGIAGIIGIDNLIFMPLSSARSVLGFEANKYSSLQVKVSDPALVDYAVSEIEEKLMLSRHVTEETKDFTITSTKTIQETVLNVMNTINLFLAGIAGVSLLVGAIGIANTMFMSVMERTRQIGTLKAIGATNFEVMEIFLFESAFIGLLGGLIGIFLGFIASGLISELGIRFLAVGARAQASLTVITPELILFGLAFSTFIGILAGILPARRAAHLQPVEALRYE